MILLYMLLFYFDGTCGLRSWTLRNINLRDTDPNSDVKTFYPDNPAVRILDEAMCRGSQTVPVKLRVFPAEVDMTVREDDMDDYTKSKLRSCLSNTTNATRCGVCWQQACDYPISIPCKITLGHSRWDSSQMIDIVVDNGVIISCQVMCRDIGYYIDDSYTGGNGISLAGVGIIITIFLALGLLAMLAVVLFKHRFVKELKEEEFPYPYNSKPDSTTKTELYPTKSQHHPFIKKEGRMIEF